MANEDPLTRVSEAFAKKYPSDVALLLERAEPSAVASLFSEWSPQCRGAVLSKMLESAGARCLAELETADGAAALETLRPARAASILAKLSSTERSSILTSMGRAAAAPVERLLEQAVGTAGSVMDPTVASLTAEMTGEAALELLRTMARRPRSHVYVVSRDGVLEGVVTVAQLVFSQELTVGSLMTKDLDSLPASASLETIASHPAWKARHQLPVVAPDGKLLGAIRYEVVRRIETELGLGVSRPNSAQTAAALGEFYGIGIAGVADWVTHLVLAPTRGSTP